MHFWKMLICFLTVQSSKWKFEFTGSNQILEFIFYIPVVLNKSWKMYWYVQDRRFVDSDLTFSNSHYPVKTDGPVKTVQLRTWIKWEVKSQSGRCYYIILIQHWLPLIFLTLDYVIWNLSYLWSFVSCGVFSLCNLLLSVLQAKQLLNLKKNLVNDSGHVYIWTASLIGLSIIERSWDKWLADIISDNPGDSLRLDFRRHCLLWISRDYTFEDIFCSVSPEIILPKTFSALLVVVFFH
jgi:hypothetical protein